MTSQAIAAPIGQVSRTLPNQVPSSTAYNCRSVRMHYNRHRALQLQAPDPATGLTIVDEGREGGVHRRDLLGGLLYEYRRAA